MAKFSKILRILDGLFCSVALVAALGLAVLWARSYSHCDVLWHQRGPWDRLEITSEFGLLVFEWEAPQRAEPKADWVYFDKPLPRRWQRARGPVGVSIYHESVKHYLLAPPTQVWGVTLPHLFLVIVLAMPGMAWLARRRREILRQIRGRGGLCTQCGYDLRGSTSGICPECGTRSVSAQAI